MVVVACTAAAIGVADDVAVAVDVDIDIDIVAAILVVLANVVGDQFVVVADAAVVVYVLTTRQQ